MAVLKINDKWYSAGDGIKTESAVPLESSYIQKEKDLYIGFVAFNEAVYPLIGFSERKRDVGVLIKTEEYAPFVIIIDDISFDDNIKADATLSELFKRCFNV